MLWLVMVLLVSLLGLLIAAVAVARFIWVQRSRARSKARRDAGTVLEAIEQNEQVEQIEQAETEL